MPAQPRDPIIVRVGSQELRGWLQSEVSRSIEQLAGTFSIPVDLIPGQVPPVKRQDQVQVILGGQVLISGHVLAAEPFYRREDCGLRIMGRDRTGDFVRSSAQHAGGQWLKAKLDRIAKDLARPYGIDVVVEADVGEPLTDFRLYQGESCLDVLSRAARQRGVLLSTDQGGRLLLTKAGRTRAPGAIRRGVNVISMEGIGTDEHRHSQYIAYAQTGMAAVGDNFESSRQVKASARDTELGRHLPLIISPDGNTTAAELQALVDHTARVRRGQAYGFRYVVEGWLVDGQPWPLNARVAIHDDIAGLDGDEWLICSVRQTCDRTEGDVTELIVRPIEAYDSVPLKSRVRRRKGAARRGRDGARLEHVKGVLP